MDKVIWDSMTPEEQKEYCDSRQLVYWFGTFYAKEYVVFCKMNGYNVFTGQKI